jgi:hypothetical protein
MAVAPDEVIATAVPKDTAPVDGLNEGVGWTFVIVYAALPTALLVHPVLTARAFNVIALFITTGPVYRVLDFVGVAPFVV